MLDNSYSLNVLSSKCSSTYDCSWLLTSYLFLRNLKTVRKSPYIYIKESCADLKFLSAGNWALPWETFVHSLWSRIQDWSKQIVKIIVFQIICFSIDYGISDPLFTYLWTFSTTFVLMQVKTGFDTPMFNYLLPFLYKIISIIYHKYGKSITKIILLPASYAMK